MKGEAVLRLLEKNERYEFTFPDYYARGILIGKLLMETVGDVKINCPDTGYTAEITFIAKGIFTGTYNALTGKVKDKNGSVVATIDGQWDETIYVTFKGSKKQVLFDALNTKTVLPDVLPNDKQHPYESRRLWEKVTAGIKAKDLDAATDGKSFLEQRQRDEAKERKEANKEWVTTHFQLENNGSWRYKNIPTGPYSQREIDAEEDLYISPPPSAASSVAGASNHNNNSNHSTASSTHNNNNNNSNNNNNTNNNNNATTTAATESSSSAVGNLIDL